MVRQKRQSRPAKSVTRAQSPYFSADTGLLACAVVCALAFVGGCSGAPPKPQPVQGPAKPPAIAWGQRPAVSPFQAREFPKPTEFILARSGVARSPMKMWVVERHDSEAVYFRWVMPGGSAAEVRSNLPSGTSSLMADLMTEGTRRHPGSRFDAALQALGGTLEVYVTADATVITGRALRAQIPALMALAREALFEPQFSRKAFDNLVTRQRARLVSWLSRPRAIAGRVYNQLLYGAKHPYGSAGLTIESLNKIRVSHLRRAQKQLIAMANSVFIAAGDVTSAGLQKTLMKTFGKEFRRKPLSPLRAVTPESVKPGCYVVDAPKAVQSVVMIGNPGPKRGVTDWATLQLSNQILGGSASSRLFTELRERKGLTYGVYSSFDGRRWAGDWSVSTSVATTKTPAALDAIRQQIGLMQSKTPAQSERKSAISYMIGQFANAQATSSGVVASLASLHAYDLPADRLQRWVHKLRGSTAADLQGAAKRWMGTPSAITVIVGNLSKIRPHLDNRCSRLIELDPQGSIHRHLIAADAEMSADERKTLFATWSQHKITADALIRFVQNANRDDVFRADALDASVGGVHSKLGPVISDKIPRWQSVATKLSDHLLIRLETSKHTAEARRWLLQLLAPQTGTSPVAETERGRINRTLVDWIFAGVSPKSSVKDVERFLPDRIPVDDLCRLGPMAIEGMESLVSIDLWREPAAACLAGMRTPHAKSALMRGYRRLFVERKAVPSAEDLTRIEEHVNVDSAILLLDTHARLRLGRALPAAADDGDRVMQSIRTLFSRMAAQRKGTDDGLEVGFDHIIHHLEALLQSPDPADRWFAADLLIHYRGLRGLRATLAGLKDDDAYGRPRPAMRRFAETPKRRNVYHDLNQLVSTRVNRLPHGESRAMLTAALAGKSRIAEIVAIAGLRAMKDPATLTILRTHRDESDVTKVIRSDKPMSLTRMARCAAAVRQQRAHLQAKIRSRHLSAKQGQALRQTLDQIWELEGQPLSMALDRALDKILAKSKMKRRPKSRKRRK